MPLVESKFKTALKVFITNANKAKQEDLPSIIDSFAGELENLVYEAIKEITITIPMGGIIVAGSATTQTNAQPIILEGIVT